MTSYSILCEINSCRATLASLYLDLKYAKDDIDSLNKERNKFNRVVEIVDDSICYQKGKLNNLMNFNPNLIFVQKCYDNNTNILDNEVKENVKNQVYEVLENFKNAEIKINNIIDDINSQINYYESRLRSLQASYQRAKEEERRKCQE